jgi:hypothetical protein
VLPLVPTAATVEPLVRSGPDLARAETNQASAMDVLWDFYAELRRSPLVS